MHIGAQNTATLDMSRHFYLITLCSRTKAFLSQFADDSALFSSDVVDFAILPTQGLLAIKRFQYGMSYDPKVTNESVPFWEKIQTYCKYWLYNSFEWCTKKYTLSHFVILKIYMNPLR